MKKYIQINPADNVIVAIDPLSAGDNITVGTTPITVSEDIPAGHKVALQDFRTGDPVIKYGFPIGHARKDIPTGSWVNEKNIKTNLEGLQDYTWQPQETVTDIPDQGLTFNGYRRKNGDVGIRNEIWIIPTVGCVNGIVNQLAETLRRETSGKDIDAIVAFPHNYGCSQLATTMRIPARSCVIW